MTEASSKPTMWYDSLPGEKSWHRLWSDYTICGHCRGIRTFEGSCAVCGNLPLTIEPQLVRDEHGREFHIPTASMGAEGCCEDWVYLGAMKREWKRSLETEDRSTGAVLDTEPSPKAVIVILFWSYFETRIERLFRQALQEIPVGILNDALRRYSAIGPRLNEFYRAAFDSTYKSDLDALGHGEVWSHLAEVQERRNAFAHGQPQAVNDALVAAVVENLKVEHEAWIAIFNKRATRP